MICRRVHPTDQDSSCQLYNFDVCRMPNMPLWELKMTVAPQSKLNCELVQAIRPILQKFQSTLDSFRSCLPVEADVLVTNIAPIRITLNTWEGKFHRKLHSLQQQSPGTWHSADRELFADTSVVLRDHWHRMCLNVEVSQRLSRVLENHYKSLSATMHVGLVHVEGARGYKQQSAGWLNMIWNIVNSALGNNAQGSRDCQSSMNKQYLHLID